MSLRISSYKPEAANGEDAPEDAFSGCPCGTLVTTYDDSRAEVHCWRSGSQPDGIGIEVNKSWDEGRSLAYAAMSEIAAGWPHMPFHIYYADGSYEHISDTPDESSGALSAPQGKETK